MPLPRIACIDVLAPAVQEQTRAVARPAFDIRFATSGSPAELRQIVKDADFLLVGPTAVDAGLISRAPRLRLIQKYGVGIEKVDLEAARRAGVAVAIAAGSNAAPVSELALALMLAVNRRIVVADRSLRAGEWMKAEMRSTCLQLDGKTVGLLGFGNIARMTARRLLGFDVKVLYHSRRRADPQTERSLRAEFASFADLLERCDVLSIHVPLAPGTRHLVDARALARMKADAIVVNTSRGGVVDEAALADALTSGRLRGAGLDVFATEPPDPRHPLLKLDNVVVLPHAGGAVFDNVRHVMEHAMGNMRRLLAGEPLPDADVVVAPPPAPASA